MDNSPFLDGFGDATKRSLFLKTLHGLRSPSAPTSSPRHRVTEWRTILGDACNNAQGRWADVLFSSDPAKTAAAHQQLQDTLVRVAAIAIAWSEWLEAEMALDRGEGGA